MSSQNTITVKYKVNVASYCNWYNLDNLALEEDEVETDFLAIKDAGGVISYIKEYYQQQGGDELIKSHSFQISTDENEILFTTTFILDGDYIDEDEIRFYTNQPADGEDEGRLGKWKNENGDLVSPMELVE